MTRAYQVYFAGDGIEEDGDTIVGSFKQALQHIEAQVFSGRGVADEDYPHLAKHALDGFYSQKLKFKLETHFRGVERIIEIREHNLDAAPGLDTVIRKIDLLNDMDPAYEVQAALYMLEVTNEQPADLADDLASRIRNRIADCRKMRQTDYEIAERFRLMESIMGSRRITPFDGSATEILYHLPEIARAKFLELSGIAFQPATMKP